MFASIAVLPERPANTRSGRGTPWIGFWRPKCGELLVGSSAVDPQRAWSVESSESKPNRFLVSLSFEKLCSPKALVLWEQHADYHCQFQLLGYWQIHTFFVEVVQFLKTPRLKKLWPPNLRPHSSHRPVGPKAVTEYCSGIISVRCPSSSSLGWQHQSSQVVAMFL